MIGDTGYRVVFLFLEAGSLNLGVTPELPGDFVLRVGDFEYIVNESRARTSQAGGTYWWDAPDLSWTAGQTVAVSLTPTTNPVSALEQRPAAPPIASFHSYPAAHQGGSSFTFRVDFSEEVQLSWRTLRDHSLEVANAEIASVKRAGKGSNRRWDVVVTPTSRDDIVIVLPAAADCTQLGAICTSSGQTLHNEVKLTVAAKVNAAATGAPSLRETGRGGAFSKRRHGPVTDSVPQVSGG